MIKYSIFVALNIVKLNHEIDQLKVLIWMIQRRQVNFVFNHRSSFCSLINKVSLIKFCSANQKKSNQSLYIDIMSGTMFLHAQNEKLPLANNTWQKFYKKTVAEM